MPTARSKTAESESLTKYVVLADAVNVTTGRKPNGAPSVTRLYRGNTINAQASDPRIAELLSMRGIVEADKADERVARLMRRSNPRSPLVMPAGKRARIDSGDEFHRITASGVAQAMSGEDDPAMPVMESVLPMDGAQPDAKDSLTAE